jgi:pyruvate kinase
MTTHGKTKILATLGPASRDIEVLLRLFDAGMDAARLNFSHGTHDDHARGVEIARRAAEKAGRPVCLVQDLQGPKIRIGQLATPSIDVPTGSRLTITTEPMDGVPGRVSTSFTALSEDARPGDRLLLDDGKIQLTVAAVQGKDVVCDVVVGGILFPRKGINLPGVRVKVPSFTDKDLDDLAFGLKIGIDYIALSFVRSAEDVHALRAVIRERWPAAAGTPIIAKVEKPEAIDQMEEIIRAADAVMVARGDLGVEMAAEDVPVLQKQIIRRCNEAGKPVIVATQMLESMVTNSTPTRAEASDVANAVLDGCDAVMLSSETSVGKYPVEAVSMMNRIIQRVEGEGLRKKVLDSQGWGWPGSVQDALGRASVVLAEQMGAAAVIAVTHTGKTATLASRYRPRTPLLAVTDNPQTLRRLSLVWGIRAILLETTEKDRGRVIPLLERELLNRGLVRQGDAVVFLSGQPLFAGGSTNDIRVERIQSE